MFKRYSESSFSSTLQVGIYDSNLQDVNDMQRGELINISMLYLLSDLVYNSKTKYITLPIMFFDLTWKDLKASNKTIAEEINKDNKKIADDKMCYVLITEHFFKMNPLKEYLVQNGKKLTSIEWKVLFFQILQALFQIQKSYPSFRHNKLDLGAIDVYMTKANLDKKEKKYIGNKSFSVPNVGFELRIGDFDKSNIQDTLDNKSTDKKTENTYYDIHHFFHSLLNIKDELKMPKDISDFIERVVPEEYRTEDGFLDESYYEQNSSGVLTPEKFLNDDIFGDLSEVINEVEVSSATETSISDFRVQNEDVRVGVRRMKRTTSIVEKHTKNENSEFGEFEEFEEEMGPGTRDRSASDNMEVINK